jgi:tetratricopeptide (TPR) repeat protein
MALAFALATTATYGGSAERQLAAGAKAFKQADYEAALKAFDEAAKRAPEEHLDAAVAEFNAGIALLQLNKPKESADRFTEALRSTDLSLQSRAYYNRGLALYRQAAALEEQSQMEAALRVMAEAGTMFEKALTLQPEDRDAKINLELSQQYVADLLDQGKLAEQLVAQVEQLVSTYEYEKARDLIAQQAPALARGFALRAKAKSRLQEMSQKIDEVLAILHPPAASAAQPSTLSAPTP